MSHPVAKRAASRLLVDECQILGPETAGSLNESTYAWEPDAVAIDWEGPCSTYTRASSRSSRDGAADLEIDEIGLRVPLEAPVCHPGTVIRFTKSADPAMVGDDYEVVRVVQRTHQVVRKMVLRRRQPGVSNATVVP